MISRTKLQQRLLGHLAVLKADELEVLITVAEGLVRGREIYGTLRIATDERDFGAEALEEIRDALVYVGSKLVRLRRAR